MHSLLSALLLLTSTIGHTTSEDDVRVLITEHYKITLTLRCAEGEVGCGELLYLGVNLKTGNSVILRGKAVMVLCADGVSPCHLGFFEFISGQFRYRVFSDGQLTVEKNRKVLLDESGSWQ